jgi:CubicO group peptidase (beta-lactamase class C family)
MRREAAAYDSHGSSEMREAGAKSGVSRDGVDVQARGTVLNQAHWQDRLAVLAEKHNVPGASLAILRGDQVVEAAYGVLNLRTGVETTPDSLFQIGSITKVWTATLIMQLVDEGLLDLDAPIVTYLPDFRVADAAVTRQVTARHLLSHTSGIDGDLILDTGRGDDAIVRYVAACSTLKQNHPLGATMSYCNAGFTVLGRVVEVLRGASWDAVLRERLFAPLGLASAGTLPEEALLHRSAVGHVPGPDGGLEVTRAWGIFRSAGPAGLIHATARDVLSFARLHINGGVAPGGARLLSAASVRAMRVQESAVPGPLDGGSRFGLAWMLFSWSGQQVFGHDGGTISQSSYLRVVPGAGVAVCLLANCRRTADLFHDLFHEILKEVADVEMPAPLEPPRQPATVDLERYAGRYSREGMDISIEPSGTQLAARINFTGPLGAARGAGVHGTVVDLVPLATDAFLARVPPDQSWSPVVFFELPGGAQYLHMGARATPKVQRPADD